MDFKAFLFSCDELQVFRYKSQPITYNKTLEPNLIVLI